MECWQEDFPDVFRDFDLALCCRVDAVGLIEFFDTADSFEEEGDEGGFGFLCDFGEEGFEAGGEFLAHVVGHLHAGDEELDFGVLAAGFFNDSEEILFGFGGGDAAKAIVSAEGDDEDVGSFCHGPGDATEAAGGGVSADPGVGDSIGECRGCDFGLKEGGVGFFGIESVAGGDAVAEDDDALFNVGCIRRFFCEQCGSRGEQEPDQ